MPHSIGVNENLAEAGKLLGYRTESMVLFDRSTIFLKKRLCFPRGSVFRNTLCMLPFSCDVGASRKWKTHPSNFQPAEFIEMNASRMPSRDSISICWFDASLSGSICEPMIKPAVVSTGSQLELIRRLPSGISKGVRQTSSMRSGKKSKDGASMIAEVGDLKPRISSLSGSVSHIMDGAWPASGVSHSSGIGDSGNAESARVLKGGVMKRARSVASCEDMRHPS